MYNVAGSISAAEQAIGLDSHLVDIQGSVEWDEWADADVHVAHTHFPNEMRARLTRPLKLVFPCHGTPEHIFYSAVESIKTGYGHGDGWMLFQYWMQNADARVTFWPRHQAIMETMVDKGTKVHLVPLGINRKFWAEGQSAGKWAGNPSVLSAENCHQIKWPLDLLLMWPWVYKEIPSASLHVNYLPNDKHRWFFPLVNRNGASFGAHISSFTFPHVELRNVFKSVDYQFSHVRYGDFNRLCLEASASGCRVISYPGNPYADFWVTEGDQRQTAADLIAVLKGQVGPRKDKQEVPDISETALAMRNIYEGICNQPTLLTRPRKSAKARKSGTSRLSSKTSRSAKTAR